MKKIATFLLFFICSYSIAQIKGDMIIKWSGISSANIGDQKIKIPQFNPDNLQIDPAAKRVYFVFQIPTSTEVNENSLQISNLVYEHEENNWVI
jgi:hypothetical protein